MMGWSWEDHAKWSNRSLTDLFLPPTTDGSDDGGDDDDNGSSSGGGDGDGRGGTSSRPNGAATARELFERPGSPVQIALRVLLRAREASAQHSRKSPGAGDYSIRTKHQPEQATNCD